MRCLIATRHHGSELLSERPVTLGAAVQFLDALRIAAGFFELGCAGFEAFGAAGEFVSEAEESLGAVAA